MNEILAAVYRKDEYTLTSLLQESRYRDRDKLNETLRVVLLDDSVLQYHEKLHFCEILFCAGASPDVVNWNNVPVLAWSVAEQDVGIFHMLMNFAPDVNAYDDEYRHILHYAVDRGNTDMVGHLLAAGASPNVQDEFGSTPLVMCFEHENNELLEMLLLDSNVTMGNYDRETPLHVLAYQKYPYAMSELLSRGADPNAADILGESPLMIAAWQSDLTCVKLLIKGGANINQKSLNGDTALHKACGVSGRENSDIIEFLIESGSDLDALNLVNNTPLFLGVCADNNSTIRVLIKANCNVDKRGNAMFQSGKVSTPLELAMMHDNLAAMAMLLLAGCRFKKFQVDKTLAHLQLSRLSTEDPKPDDVDEDKFSKFIDLITHITRMPQSLRLLCRSSLRAYVGQNITTKLEDLQLPSKIKDYLTLIEVDQSFCS